MKNRIKHYRVRIWGDGEECRDIGIVTEHGLRINNGYFLLYELNEPHNHIGFTTAGVIRYELIPVYEVMTTTGC